MACNVLACVAEALVLVTIGPRGVARGVLEGLIASTSTVSSVIDEVTHETDTVHDGSVWRAGVSFLLAQIVVCTLLPLAIFAVAGDAP